MIPLLENLIHRTLQGIGLDLKRYNTANDPHLRRQTILEHHAIDFALDVGANRGQYGQRLRENGYRRRILSLEPSSESFAELQRIAGSSPPWDCLPLALDRRSGSGVLHLASNSVSSSLLEMSPAMEAVPGARYIGQESVEVQTLDQVGEAHIPRSAALLVKLDVQGSEQAVLDSGPKLLDRTRLIEIELAWSQLYVGQAKALELLNQLSSMGFDLVSTTPNTLHPQSGEVLEYDALLARRPKGE